jgi:3-phenylpropionate/trans-cinnamate dioxygenase ferredoxin subunit
VFHEAMPADWVAPGDTATVDVDGYPVAIANVEGTFCAFEHLCPHQGAVGSSAALSTGARST